NLMGLLTVGEPLTSLAQRIGSTAQPIVAPVAANTPGAAKAAPVTYHWGAADPRPATIDHTARAAAGDADPVPLTASAVVRSWQGSRTTASSGAGSSDAVTSVGSGGAAADAPAAASSSDFASAAPAPTATTTAAASAPTAVDVPTSSAASPTMID